MGGNQSQSYVICKDDKRKKLEIAKDKQQHASKIYKSHIKTKREYIKKLNQCRGNSQDNVIPYDYCEKINQGFQELNFAEPRLRQNKKKASSELYNASKDHLYGCTSLLKHEKYTEPKKDKELENIKLERKNADLKLYKKGGIKAIIGAKDKRRKKRRKRRRKKT
jgi:hypothetical protein